MYVYMYLCVWGGGDTYLNKIVFCVSSLFDNPLYMYLTLIVIVTYIILLCLVHSMDYSSIQYVIQRYYLAKLAHVLGKQLHLVHSQVKAGAISTK